MHNSGSSGTKTASNVPYRRDLSYCPAKPVQVVLAQPRGFCAGVIRAIDIVEHALTRFGAPVYVRHEIVHNRHVVESLRAKGARFVEHLSEVPPGAITVFSAHGVARVVENDAAERQLRLPRRPTRGGSCELRWVGGLTGLAAMGVRVRLSPV